jgi:2-methylisocitrate lyase-like PEP mutase family enzyme
MLATQHVSGPAKLRALLKRPGIIRSLGAHDVFTALLVEQAGFEAVFLGGFGASASLLGLPDLNFISAEEMADAARRMTARLAIPVIVDGDTGHGDLHNVARTVQLFERAGAAGMLLEDQVAPKRCGHFEGKQVIDTDEMVLKLRAAQQARANPDFVIIARTDAREALGLQPALDRANRYGAAGADMVFIEAPLSREELEALPRAVPYPHLANMLTGGKTPILPVAELERLGYKLAVCPIETLLVTARAVQHLARTLMDQGRVDTLSPDRMASFAEVKQILGVEEYLEMRERLSG